MKELVYPTITTVTNDGFYEVNIPDFNLELGAYGETPEEALSMALDVVVSCICENGFTIPKPSNISDIKKQLKENQFVGLVSFNPYYQYSLIKQVFKNKMVTLPTWLETLARNKNLNFSQILQKALKEELNIN